MVSFEAGKAGVGDIVPAFYHPKTHTMHLVIAPMTLLVCCFAVSVSAESQLSVQLDRSLIYEGESFFYQLTVSGTSPVGNNVVPDTSAWTDFDVQSLGRPTVQQGGSSFTMVINGRTIRDDRTAVSYQTQFRYLLTPKRTGSLTIPLPRVIVNGNMLQPQSFSVDEGERQMFADFSVAVRVLEPDNQDIAFLSIETNRNRFYPLQPLEVTLVVQLKGLPGRFAEIDPLTRLQQPPQLQIPWAASDPKGFQSTQRLESWLGDFLVRSPRHGFAINDYVSGGVFGGFRGFGSFGFGDDMFQRNLLQFSSTPRQMTRFNAQGHETTYWEYRFTRMLIPQEFGNYSFGPVSLRGVLPVADPANPDGIIGQRVYAIARPVNVAVVDVPQENRPADYIGAFGSFRWDAMLTPQQARVGDPLTLTLRLSGQGSTVNVRPIDLSANPDVAANFRIHPPTEEMTDQSCTYTYTIRPLNSGAIVFPPISVSVFDVNTERFVSLQSLPIPLEIAEAEFVQSATLFGSVSDGNLQLAEGGLHANKTTLSERLPSVTFVQWAITVSLLLGCYAIIATVVLLSRHQWVSPQRQRQRGALNRAKSRLAAISATLRSKDAHFVGERLVEISGELQGVFFGYTADKTNGVEQGMTTSDVCRQLSENQVPESLVNVIRSALESLDAVKYGGMDTRSLGEWTTIAGTLLQQLDRHK